MCSAPTFAMVSEPSFEFTSSPFVTSQAPLDSPLSLYGASAQLPSCKDFSRLGADPPQTRRSGILGLSSGWYSFNSSDELPSTLPQQPQSSNRSPSRLTKLFSALSSKHQSLRQQCSGKQVQQSGKDGPMQQLPSIYTRHIEPSLTQVNEDDDGNELGVGSCYHSPQLSPASCWALGNSQDSPHADTNSTDAICSHQRDGLALGAAAAAIGSNTAASGCTSTTWSTTPSPGSKHSVSPPVAIPAAGPHNDSSSTNSWHSPATQSLLAPSLAGNLEGSLVPGEGTKGQRYGDSHQVWQCSLARLSAPLSPCSSLRTALLRLEAAGARAGHIMGSLSAGLMRLTSLSVAAGVLRQPVGREVLRDWEFGPTLGCGASAVTRLVTNRCTARPAACKTINKAGIFASAAAKAALMDVQREVAILQHVVGHPNVTQLQAVYEDARAVHLVMEWCSGGSVVQLMQRCPHGMLGERAAAAVMKAVLEVLAHCHDRGLMLRDVKPDNVLIAQPINDIADLTSESIKVADFGISVLAPPGGVLSELAGTADYMAPEVLLRCYSQQADVWSAGIMLYELLTGTVPFHGATCEQMLAAITTTELSFDGPHWVDVSDEAKQLLFLMLTKDPEVRPTPQQLLDTFAAWLEQGSSNALSSSK